jgi:glycosyltransferase involved in cell wall biosynthesis
VDFSKFNKNLFESLAFRKKFNIDEKDFLVGTACFMRSWKGINDFLKTAKLLEHEKNIKFVLIGEGHIGTYIKMAKELNLKNVVFTYHLENPTSAISALDIFVLLSTAHEGVSQASLQAAYLEKPLITTPTGGLKEVCINNVTGIQVPIFSPDKVASAILKIWKNEKLRWLFAQNAKELALKFSLDSMLNQMNSIYLNLFK